jgi:hypothetical protein
MYGEGTLLGILRTIENKCLVHHNERQPEDDNLLREKYWEETDENLDTVIFKGYYNVLIWRCKRTTPFFNLPIVGTC